MNFLNLGIREINGKSMKTYRNFEWLKSFGENDSHDMVKCICSIWNKQPYKEGQHY
jgi:hypothetical protein